MSRPAPEDTLIATLVARGEISRYIGEKFGKNTAIGRFTRMTAEEIAADYGVQHGKVELLRQALLKRGLDFKPPLSLIVDLLSDAEPREHDPAYAEFIESFIFQLLDYPAFMDRGACVDTDVDVMATHLSEDRPSEALAIDVDSQREALQLCARCEVRAECRDYADGFKDKPIQHGVFGGKSYATG